MKYVCVGFDRTGKAVRETIEAPSAEDAAEQARRKGLFVTETRAAGAASRRNIPAQAGAWSGVGEGKRMKQLASFLRQLSMLVSTGTPLVDAMTSLEKQTPEGELRTVVGRIRAKVEEGVTLAEAIAEHPRWFDAVSRSLIAAGESGGGLAEMLTRLSALVRRQVKVRQQTVGALVYPCVLLAIALGVSIAMITFVLPRFEGLFKTLDAPLPASTAVLMDLSTFVRAHWMMLCAFVAAMLGAGWWMLNTPAGKSWRGAVLLALPRAGDTVRAFTTARIARLLGVLMLGRVGLLEALKLVRESLGLGAYRTLIESVEQGVTRGENISQAIVSAQERMDMALIEPSVIEALRSAEKSGRVGEVLVAMADHMDEDNEVALKALMQLIEPAILLLLGVIVGTVAVSMFLPLFDLTGAGGGLGPGAGGGAGGGT
ncbi:MAG: type II secretion system F family protein [Planctomycetota bacterium]|nr:type II secretion system F family protein [Planctomycetota bacterium]